MIPEKSHHTQTRTFFILSDDQGVGTGICLEESHCLFRTEVLHIIQFSSPVTIRRKKGSASYRVKRWHSVGRALCSSIHEAELKFLGLYNFPMRQSLLCIYAIL